LIEITGWNDTRVGSLPATMLLSIFGIVNSSY
jgi:hypothetical protein